MAHVSLSRSHRTLPRTRHALTGPHAPLTTLLAMLSGMPMTAPQLLASLRTCAKSCAVGTMRCPDVTNAAISFERRTLTLATWCSDATHELTIALFRESVLN